MTSLLSSVDAQAQSSQTSLRTKTPNIVFILADDLGYGDVGCLGQEKIPTPNIDRLAARGKIFTQHYAGSSVSAPSRSCLVTGQHTGHTPIRGNKEMPGEGQRPLPRDIYTVFQLFKEHGCNVYLAAEIKKHVKVPVATIGGLNDPAQMEEIIASGKADIVYMARALLADPFLPNKVMANRADEIVRCLRCFTCMAERAATATRRCTVNPQIGREQDAPALPARRAKKVIVAGGGCGGMKAAVTAAQRGHHVILCEKDAELGGILKSEQAIPFVVHGQQLVGDGALRNVLVVLGRVLLSTIPGHHVHIAISTKRPHRLAGLLQDQVVVASDAVELGHFRFSHAVLHLSPVS